MKMGPLAKVESRAFEHKYFIRRPRDTQAPSHHEAELRQVLLDGTSKDSTGLAMSSRPGFDSAAQDQKENAEVLKGVCPLGCCCCRALTDPFLGYANLFIDLVWASVIKNISELFSDTAFEGGMSWGQAFGMFVVLYLTAWRLWNYLRDVSL